MKWRSMTYKQIANLGFIVGMLALNAASLMWVAPYGLTAFVAVTGINMIVWAFILNGAPEGKR